MKLEVALTLTTISIPILQTRMAPHSLTLYTLTSVWIFSILFAIYFILYWQWEFFKIKASEVVIIFFILMI